MSCERALDTRVGGGLRRRRTRRSTRGWRLPAPRRTVRSTVASSDSILSRWGANSSPTKSTLARGVVDDLAHLRRRQPPVHVDQHRVDLRRREGQLEVVGRVLLDARDAVVGLHAGGEERVGELAAPLVELAPGDLAIAVHDGDLIGPLRPVQPHDPRDVGDAHASPPVPTSGAAGGYFGVFRRVGHDGVGDGRRRTAGLAAQRRARWAATPARPAPAPGGSATDDVGAALPTAPVSRCRVPAGTSSSS